jgi:hypothetical protein
MTFPFHGSANSIGKAGEGRFSTETPGFAHW